ncbi:hypothetical protein TNCV_3709781 [Trichonephila clavipes]|nr:hypothetical protein TNCV_3709781 [Trichonephila clavipes]
MNKVRLERTCPIVITEYFAAVDDDNVFTDLNMTSKDILEFVQSSKNIIEVDFYDEKEMNNAALVSTSSEMRNIKKSMSS